MHESLEKHYMTLILCQSRAETSNGPAKILERSKIPLEYTMQPGTVREIDEMCTKVSRIAFMLFQSPWGQFYSKVIPKHLSEQ